MRAAILFLALTPLAYAAGPEDPVAQVRALTWLAGHWRGATWDARYSTPEGGMILSMAKEFRADGTVGFFEYERISVREGEVVLQPSPFGEPSVPFRLTALDLGARRARFENPGHDFPRVITYQRTGDAELVFELEGVQGGEPVRSRTVLRRVPGP